ncbi:hypothetical protein ACB098_10G010000 [Castanea mollissima]
MKIKPPSFSSFFSLFRFLSLPSCFLCSFDSLYYCWTHHYFLCFSVFVCTFPTQRSSLGSFEAVASLSVRSPITIFFSLLSSLDFSLLTSCSSLLLLSLLPFHICCFFLLFCLLRTCAPTLSFPVFKDLLARGFFEILDLAFNDLGVLFLDVSASFLLESGVLDASSGASTASLFVLVWSC